MVWCLGIDTSTEFLSIALSSDFSNFFFYESAGVNSHDYELAEKFSALCCEARIEPKEISRVILGSGPGSFTGLRIGFSFAKGLAHALQIPLSCLSSLKTIAYSCREEGSVVAALADARRQEYFCGIYSIASANEVSELMAPCIMGDKAIIDKLASAANGLADRCLRVGIVAASGNLDWAFQTEYPVKKARNLAENLLLAGVAEGLIPGPALHPIGRTASAALAEITPHYVRAVSAKTLAERHGGG